MIRATAWTISYIIIALSSLVQPRRGWYDNLFAFKGSLASRRLGIAHGTFTCGYGSKFPVLKKEGCLR